MEDRLFVATSNGVDWSHITYQVPYHLAGLLSIKILGIDRRDGSGTSANAIYAAGFLTYGKIDGQDILFKSTDFYTHTEMKDKGRRRI